MNTEWFRNDSEKNYLLKLIDTGNQPENGLKLFIVEK